MGKLHKLVATTAIVSTVAFGLAQVADADTYTVKKGDTLWDIAVNNGTTVDQLMRDNNLTSSLIFPGDKLTYTASVEQVAQAKAEGYYTVVLGDTLGKVANKFGTSVDQLVKLNNVQNPNLIFVGEVLKIKETEVKVQETPVKTEAKVEVKKEETKAPAKAEVQTKAEVKVAAPTQTVAPAPAAPVVTKTATPVATTQVATSNKGAAIYQAALAQLGRYQDCTMLVTNALKSVGISYHNWPAGYLSLGTVVPASQAQPGDLVYYANGGMGLAHIAVYAGNGQAIHGGWNGNQTVVNTVNVGSGPVFVRVR